MKYTNSSLVTYTNISPNRTRNRNHKIDTITIHCIVGQWTAKHACDYFAQKNVKGSANYAVGRDGSIGLAVEEKDRSWCSSSKSNDHRAITIEVASDLTPPYAVTEQAYEALIKLVADICKRNGIKKLLWKNDKSLIGQVDKQNMTVHRWFANTACPGDYLMSKQGDIANRVNAILESEKPAYPSTPFLVDVTIPTLNVRSAPSMTGTVRRHTGIGRFTIVAVEGEWGYLKSGAGWICLANKNCKVVK